MMESAGEFLANSQKIYLFIAVFGSVIFAVLFALTVIGLHGGEADVGAGGILDDFQPEAHDIADIEGLNFFSLKSIVAFLTFFGWGGFFFGHLGWGGLAIAFGCGLLMMFLTALVISLLLKLQQSGNLRSADFLGRRGTVYLTIPAGRQPGGMVTVLLENCTRQVKARADEEIATGCDVVIESDLGGEVFLVRRNEN